MEHQHALTTKDVNTLLLKSQYNHINHLDKKLDEVTDSVVNLEGKFDRLEDKVDNHIAMVDTKMTSLEATMNAKMTSLETTMDAKMTSLETTMDAKLSGMDLRLVGFETSIKLDIEEAINKNMRWSITLIVVLVGILKLADTFAK